MSRARLPSCVTVAGAGTMGAGMAAVLARAGCSVRLTARREETLPAARERVEMIAGAASSRDEWERFASHACLCNHARAFLRPDGAPRAICWARGAKRVQ